MKTFPVFPPRQRWSDHPYEHSWAHQALLELICVAGPEMHLMRDQNIDRNFMVDFSTCRNSERFSVNWKIKHVCLWEKAFPKTSPYIFLWISLMLNFKQNRVCRNPLNSQSPFFLWCKETVWESMAVQLFCIEEKWPALNTAGGSLRCQREAAHKWHPVGISAGLHHPEDFRTYLTHLHALQLPFISGKRPKLKWKLMCWLTSLLFMFVSFSLMYSVYYNELKNNNS